MGLEPYHFVSSLNCVLTQRLCRVLCDACKAPAVPSAELLEESALTDEAVRGRTLYEPRGCAACNYTGYRGRTVVAELVEVTDQIRELILARRPGAEIRRAAREAGTRTLRESAFDKAFGGLTSLAEINRVTLAEP
jgi:type IV pilus assembly protein PilB